MPLYVFSDLKMRIKQCIKTSIILLVVLIVLNGLICIRKMDDYLNTFRIFDRPKKQIDNEPDLLDSSEVNDYANLVYKSLTNFKLDYCSEIPSKLVGRIKILKPPHKFDAFSNKLLSYPVNYTRLENGRWSPIDCRPRHRVAIIIPYKNRLNNLNYFLTHMHPFMQKQKLEYQIFVVEQSNDQMFNKGVLMNGGFVEIMSLKANLADIESLNQNTVFPFDCVIFHDVDLLPEGECKYISRLVNKL